MSMSNAAENALLLLIFNGTTWANIADNAATSPNTQIASSLMTADPGEAGTMATSEAAYTSYARQNVNRNSGGFTVTNNEAALTAALEYPAATGTPSETLSYFAWGKTGGGSTAIHFSGTVSPAIAVTAAGHVPRLTTASKVSID